MKKFRKNNHLATIIKLTSAATAIALLLPLLVPTVSAKSIGTTAPYSGEVLVAVNATSASFFLSNADSSVSTPQSFSSYSLYSIPKSREQGVIGYDSDGNGLLEPALSAPEIPFPTDAGNSSDDTGLLPDDQHTVYPDGSTKNFSVQITQNSSATSSLNFTLLTSGSRCTVWTPTNGQYDAITTAEAITLAAEFDRHYSTMVTAFGDPMSGSAADPDKDGKIAIVCYDIKDDNGLVNTYTAGFFSSADMLTSKVDMIHMDSGQGMKNGVEQSFGTLIHEFQHLINHVRAGYRGYIKESAGAGYYGMPVFLNEGLSMAAEMMIYEGTEHAPTDRISYYNSSNTTFNYSVTLWESSLINYSLDFMFMQYLRILYKDPDSTEEAGRNGTILFKDIIDIRNSFSSLPTETQYFDKIASELFNTDTTTLITNFYLSLYLKEDSGTYGFDGESWADAISPKQYTSTFSPTVPAGGAVYFGVHSNYTPTVTPSTASFAFLSVNDGAEVSGSIISHNPMHDIMVTLRPVHGGADIKTTIYSLSYEAGITTDVFDFSEVPFGMYDLIVSKEGHLTTTISDVVINSSLVNLGQAITLIPGDINGDSVIDIKDLGIVTSAANYNKTITILDQQIADINGDGYVNFIDAAIIRNAAGFDKTAPVIDYQP